MESETVISKLNLAPLDALLELFEESLVMPLRSMENLKNQYLEVLTFLRVIFINPQDQSVRDDVLKEFTKLGSKVGCIISAFDLKKMDEVMAHKLYKQLIGPLRTLKFWTYTIQFEMNEPKPSSMYHPRTDPLGFVDHLVENHLEQLLMKRKPDLICPLKIYILELQRMLHLISCSLKQIPEPRKEEIHIKELIRSISDIAYEVEYIIDSYLVRKISTCCCMSWLRDVLSEATDKASLVKMEFGDVKSIVSFILNTDPNKFNIIPIVIDTEHGMNLLKEIFDDPAIIKMFPKRIWSLAPSYKQRKKEVFVDRLFTDLSFWWDRLKKAGSRYFLSLKKYLIFFTDVEDIAAVNDIISLSASLKYGSTILVTTRSPELAAQLRHGSQKVSVDNTSTLQIGKPTTNDHVVGFRAEIEGMLELLTRGPKKLCLISIVGMAGQGKTTLAKKLYTDTSIISYFDARTWCCVSQSYKKRELLLELLGHVVQLSDTIHHKNDEELAEMLYKNLKGRRFLIFLDDIWEISAWNDLARCFPDDKNGSRIMFTSRIQELASQAKSDSKLQNLSLLSDDESWELLTKKLFENKSCPPQLSGIGREIAKNCKGLPLSIILTAGILAKMEKTVDQWKEIADSLSSRILDDAEADCKGVIELSFKNLPDHLKPCFLYFGTSLEDKEVLVCKLIRLWIAEGFIKHSDMKSFEDVADDYLMDLISRSLVTVGQEKSKGGVKSCRVHDLLREFCLTKAREENFLEKIHGYDKHFPSSNDNLDYGVDPNYSCSSTHIEYHLRRLCIFSKRNRFIMLKPSGPLVRSLLFFASSDMCPSYSYDVSFISQNFKLLTILDLEDINIGDSFKPINMLVLLRYLAIHGCFSIIPSSIANLFNLETLLIKGLRAEVVKIPDSFWDMSKLRHVHINGSVSFDLDPHRLENSSILDNLQTFSTPSLAYGSGMEKMMRRLRGIRKLKCIFLDSGDGATNCKKLPELESFRQLISLNVFYNGEGRYPFEFSFPSNLKKLTLSNFRMPWNQMSQLAMLCNLEVLKLLNNAFEGEIWEMEEEVFTNLKFLKLDTLDVLEWSATGDHFPHLERLLLHKCKQLKEIPLGIGDIPTLQMIEVMWCSTSVAVSAKQIQEVQREFGNEELKVNLLPKVWDL